MQSRPLTETEAHQLAMICLHTEWAVPTIMTANIMAIGDMVDDPLFSDLLSSYGKLIADNIRDSFVEGIQKFKGDV